ncbi:MAG: MbtH family NRPS accessory protein [Pseudomonadota bacterium]
MDDDNTKYSVVINHEEQYSIWPTDREVPIGWDVVVSDKTKQDALDHIEEVWIDMRPLSLRKKMAEAGKG